jgi:hypothetical protein
MPRRSQAALSNAAALCQSKFGDDVSRPEAVRPKSVAQPVQTARGSHPQHSQGQLTRREAAIRGVGRCGCWFPVLFSFSQRICILVPGR